MIAQAHIHKYGTTRKQLAEIAVKNHLHGSMNPLAQYPQKITVDDVLNSPMIADPLRVLDCSPITDGASAVILCPLELAKKISKKPLVKIIGSGHATDSIALHSRADVTELKAVTEAAQKAYKMAGVNPGSINVAEVHDCFTIAEICVLEAIGVVEKGHGGEAAESGMTALGGRLPVNTSGGLKSKGHPVGATGVAQAVEIVHQLRSEAGDRQVKNAKIGLAQNMGGSGGSCVVHIMEAM
jgi:acetyl-CoA C-acetyltransferase